MCIQIWFFGMVGCVGVARVVVTSVAVGGACMRRINPVVSC